MQINLLSHLFLSAYRDSQAAGALDCYLDREDAPDWYDWGQTRWPKVSTVARTEGLAKLVHMSRYFDRYAKAYQSGRFDNWPRLSDIQSHEGKYERPEDAQRLREIGFDRNELIEYLDKIGIPHTLGEVCSVAENVQQSASDNVPFEMASDSNHAIHPAIVQDNSGQEQIGNQSEYTPTQAESQVLNKRPVKVGLPTRYIANAFDGPGNWNEEKWAKNLPQVAWAKTAITHRGRRGKGGATLWNPVLLAQLAMENRRAPINMRQFAAVFRTKMLEPWLDEWREYEEKEKYFRKM